ncbi:MAG: lytic transglycosylase domain-containing protein [Gammaproteobacteria bacterium]|nr:lytic transglycosylase domain-containing protein [Gammaproteobacteria bacterium]
MDALTFKPASDSGKRYKPELFFIFFISLFSTSPVLASNIYKYTDGNGLVHYSAEKPPLELGYKRLSENCFYNSSSCSRSRAARPWSSEPLDHSSFASFIKRTAEEYEMDVALLRAIIHVESGFNPYAVSNKGARGLMQLMPLLLQAYKVSRPYDYQQNIIAGTRHMAYLLKRFNQNISLATAAYNAGETAVNKYKSIPPYKETQNYVRKVHFLFKRYRMAALR